ncbi:serine hydrolase [Aquimarina megaterium]|uniref:serine hydrolase n=1 Tax=Aquimarina megaterium TaxID=1443666 RepID=UPI00094280A7|nr:serine hydrolase [Aquimarina megaterium]
MIKKIITLLILFQIILSGCFTQNETISDGVKENVKSRVKNGTNTGIVIGVITSKGITYYSYGVKSLKTNEPVNENSVFEIGSISKTFTGVLLADMVIKGELNLDDPLQKFLPNGITAPTYDGKSIKLSQMSNHTSSLPGMPGNFAPVNSANPYVDYTEKQLYTFLDNYQITRDIGSTYEYSNYSQGLLGHVLANKRQMSYEELMTEIIANPLQLENTRITFTHKMKENLAIGHNSIGEEVENWDIPTLAGAGAIRSTAADMINYLAANMGLIKSDLYPAMQLSHRKTTNIRSDLKVGLGWHILLRDKLEIVFHTGATGGYRAFAGFIKDGDKGVIVLTNSKDNVNVDDIGIHLLDSTSALKKTSITVPLKKSIENEGIEVATITYWKLKKNKSDNYDFGENQLNSLGYYYLGNREIEKAITVFKLNTEVFPTSSNVYNSYGEALMKNNEKEEAIINYKKSAVLNPSNTNSLMMLKKLGVDTENLLQKNDN